MDLSPLNLYIGLILVIKILFLFRIVQLSYYRFFKPRDKKKIQYIKEKKEQIDWFFLTLTFGLMIYLFRLINKKPVSIDGHTKFILAACGFVGLAHQLQEKFEI
tara:strand:+ start:166 stop:477 length:312 start_codon:yes stop_codon:yes gene_type:complete